MSRRSFHDEKRRKDRHAPPPTMRGASARELYEYYSKKKEEKHMRESESSSRDGRHNHEDRTHLSSSRFSNTRKKLLDRRNEDESRVPAKQRRMEHIESPKHSSCSSSGKSETSRRSSLHSKGSSTKHRPTERTRCSSAEKRRDSPEKPTKEKEVSAGLSTSASTTTSTFNIEDYLKDDFDVEDDVGLEEGDVNVEAMCEAAMLTGSFGGVEEEILVEVDEVEEVEGAEEADQVEEAGKMEELDEPVDVDEPEKANKDSEGSSAGSDKDKASSAIKERTAVQAPDSKMSDSKADTSSVRTKKKHTRIEPPPYEKQLTVRQEIRSPSRSTAYGASRSPLKPSKRTVLFVENARPRSKEHVPKVRRSAYGPALAFMCKNKREHQVEADSRPQHSKEEDCHTNSRTPRNRSRNAHAPRRYHEGHETYRYLPEAVSVIHKRHGKPPQFMR
ncbi:hypothetical protein L596_011247 [Steinernema carpocapsae]|uniref:Uncharacterized protein n=2 Tax=Steinernema carpocapsae TaxID=34508 RepID=A0A4U5NTR6_STECR|nr:hypothetical protein L596_011247 [Steinernema carpocapsae]